MTDKEKHIFIAKKQKEIFDTITANGALGLDEATTGFMNYNSLYTILMEVLITGEVGKELPKHSQKN